MAVFKQENDEGWSNSSLPKRTPFLQQKRYSWYSTACQFSMQKLLKMHANCCIENIWLDQEYHIVLMNNTMLTSSMCKCPTCATLPTRKRTGIGIHRSPRHSLISSSSYGRPSRFLLVRHSFNVWFHKLHNMKFIMSFIPRFESWWLSHPTTMSRLAYMMVATCSKHLNYSNVNPAFICIND